MKISLSGRIIEVEYRYCQMSVPEFMRFASNIGYDAVELRATQVTHETSMEEASEYRRVADDLGLDISCINMTGIKDYESDLEVFKRYVDLAQTLRCEYLKTWNVDVALLRKLCDYADDYGLKLVAQTHTGGPLETIDSIIKTCDDIGRENFGVIFDAANLFVAGEEYGAEAVKRLGRHIFQVSIQSLREAKDKSAEGVMEYKGFYYERCLIGDEGGIDFYDVFRGLREIGFDGYVTIIEPISKLMDNKELARYAYKKVKELLIKAGYSIP